MPKANIALNAWNGISRSARRLSHDAQRTWGGESSMNNLTYAFRNKEAQAAYRKADRQGTLNDFKYGPGSVSWGRVGAVGLGGYAIADTVGRIGTGGSITRNAQGQRDIVGMPLL